jgi:uncharacterized protein YyaL (SSP411 family)
MAETILAALAGDVETNPAVHTTLLLAADSLASQVQVVVVGTPEVPGFDALWKAATMSLPQLGVVQRRPVEDELPANHPAAGKSLLGGRAAAYVCRGATCGPPVGDAAVLREQLQQPLPSH